jgi:mono/diheme cytochrome c family protein
MRRSAFVVVLLFALVVGARGLASQNPPPAQGARPDGWTIPPEAKTETSPLQVTDKVVASGKSMFRSKCSRCHGPEGKGNGPDADPEHAQDMDLTNPDRAASNPDGVVFYRIWNGRQQPKMPAFKSEMTREDVWTIVSYVQTLRKK